MDYSSGNRDLLVQAGSWLALAAAIALGLYNFDAIRVMIAGSLHEEARRQVALAEPAERTAPREAAAPRRADRSVQIRSHGNGHFNATFYINGRPVEAMVDTGATVIALTYDDARAIGIHPGEGDFRHSVQTANGTARVAVVQLDSVAIDDITVRDVRAVVTEQGRLGTTLLGMSFLSRLSSFQVSSGVLTLQQ